ncbi:uncharacterized protein N7500_008873, partial [Penicillium coprophilum]|uniref:uncharacterized protein n=1 Tax=Penicillium coprophilum TaxID=36646 RepID=UPI0023A01D39
RYYNIPKSTLRTRLQSRGSAPYPSTVTNFVKRYPSLSSKFSRRYNYERTKYEDLKFRIDPNDIYNFDKTSFTIGLTIIAKVRINYIDKLNFLKAYLSARIKAFKLETIKNSFIVAGLSNTLLKKELITKLVEVDKVPPSPPQRSPSLVSDHFYNLEIVNR